MWGSYLSRRFLITPQNKWEHISIRALDLVVDHLNTLNDLTPKINCKSRNGVDPNLIFGVDSKLFLELGALENKDVSHTDEVETITIYRGPSKDQVAENIDDPHGGRDIEVERNAPDDTDIIDTDNLTRALECLSKESVWRVKGFVKLHEGVHILNWAFGRFDLTKVEGGMNEMSSVRLTVMGERGEVKRASRKFAASFHADVM
jgi:G3E family GTPase